MKMKTPEERITKAKIELLLTSPFFGTLATKLKTVIAKQINGKPCATAMTNGEMICWNPDFLAKLNPQRVKGVLAHEVLHVANGHTWRRNERDPVAWNEACDYAINSVLKEAGLLLPPGVLYPKKGEEGRAAEAYYKAPNPSSEPEAGEDEDEGGQAGVGNGGNSDEEGDESAMGEVMDAPAGTAKEQESNWKIAVAQATENARSQGLLPAGLERMVNELLNPKVPWGIVLRDFIERSAKNDYNWTRPNRRHLQRGFALPSLISDELPEIVIVIDTSVSITPAELEQFSSEVSDVFANFKTTIHLLFADAEVASAQELTNADLPLKLEPKGGGGTDFRPAFDWVAEQGITPATFIYLTDMCGPFPTIEPEYPVLWVATTDRVAPIGQTIRMA